MSSRVSRLAAAGLMIAGLGLFATDTRAAPRTAPFPFCAWWVETTPATANVALPDSSAAYWTTPFQTSPDLASISVEGSYTDARYFSLNVYTNGAASYTCGSQSSAIADFNIAPGPGSTNPFQQPANPGGAYTVSVAQNPAPGTANTIPFFNPATCEGKTSSSLPANLGFLILRVYLSHDGFDKVALPKLTLHYADGHATPLEQCSVAHPPQSRVNPALKRKLDALLVGKLQAKAAPPKCPGGQNCPSDLVFFKPTDGSTGGLFPNVDNKYVAAFVQPVPGQVVLVRGKAASVPPGTQALPWNPDKTQMRYWSLCSYIDRAPYPVVEVKVKGQEIAGCSADPDTALDAAGNYTYVLSTPADRPSAKAISASHATWVPFTAEKPAPAQMLVLRNMLANGFASSVQQCTGGTDQAAITACQSTMGAYYPIATACPLTVFESGGASACLKP